MLKINSFVVLKFLSNYLTKAIKVKSCSFPFDHVYCHFGFPWWLSSEESACNAGDAGNVGSIPGSWTVTRQAPLSMGFLRQEYWSGFPFPSPGDLPNPGIELTSPPWQADSLPTEPPGKPL